MSPSQSEADLLVEHFIDNATDWRSLAAMTAGGIAYRWGKIGVMGLNGGAYCNTPLRIASITIGLVSEITAFEFTNRFLISVQGSRSKVSSQPETLGLAPETNLWSWSGPGGWKEGWLHSLVNFAALKGFGRFTESENLLLRHASQDLGMILGHHAAYGLGLGEKPQGSLGEQWARTEAVNLQFGFGNRLFHEITGGKLYSLERDHDLAPPKLGLRSTFKIIKLSELLAETGPSPSRSPRIWAMAEMEGAGGGGEAKKSGIAELNEQILNADLKAIGEAGVYYVVPYESIGGNAGAMQMAVNGWFEPENGKIVAIGNPQEIPPEVSKHRREFTLVIKVSFFDKIVPAGEPPHSVVKVLFDRKGLDPAIAEHLEKLKGKPFQALHSDLADYFGHFDARAIATIAPRPGSTAFVIGRGTAADLRLEDPVVSRIHATFQKEEDGNWKIYDGAAGKASKQGVFLATPEGWVRLAEPTLLEEGHIIGIVTSEGFKLYRWEGSGP